jgi:hypothetical protein
LGQTEQAIVVERRAEGERVDPAFPQRLALDDVAGSGDDALIEQQLADGAVDQPRAPQELGLVEVAE